ncbi:MAG: alpha/beta hydrolase-fold protein [Ferruginibacter sp.]
MQKILFGLCCLIYLPAFAQFNITLRIQAPKDSQGDIFIAGNFNNWNPSDASFKLHRAGAGQYSLELKNRHPDMYDFKFTRGSWTSVETTKNGSGINNRVLNLQSDTTLDIVIENWADNFTQHKIETSASAQVHILDTAFFIPQLNRYRRIWIYLPAGYEVSKKNYPVWYMQDGQNLFDVKTAPYGEWGIDEFLDSAAASMNNECIIVGIDHGGEKRMTEYNPYDTKEFGKGEGKAYVDFLANTLKPFIDHHYRTKRKSKYTTIGGSSMGGLISLYAAATYPDVFGNALVFSPAFWLAPQIKTEMENARWKKQHRFYFYAGGKESKTMITDMETVAHITSLHKHTIIFTTTDAEALHNENAWRKYFPLGYKALKN